MPNYHVVVKTRIPGFDQEPPITQDVYGVPSPAGALNAMIFGEVMRYYMNKGYNKESATTQARIFYNKIKNNKSLRSVTALPLGAPESQKKDVPMKDVQLPPETEQMSLFGSIQAIKRAMTGDPPLTEDLGLRRRDYDLQTNKQQRGLQHPEFYSKPLEKEPDY